SIIDPTTIGSFISVSVTGASDDGSLLVGTETGFSNIDSMPVEASWVWTMESGYVPLADYLTAAGLDPGGETGLYVRGISPDGTMLFGSGYANGIQPSAWVAVVPEPGSWLLATAVGAVLVFSRRTRSGGHMFHVVTRHCFQHV